MNYTNLPDRSRCVGCMGCATACAKGVLCASYDGDEHMYPSLRDGGKMCVDCGRCVSKCPVLKNGRPVGRTARKGVYAAWAKDCELRARSASGGAFAALARDLLDRGWLVWGAESIGFDVRHVCVDDVRDLSRLQGSKYILGDMTGVYARVAGQLREGRNVLFSGLPCQCAAMRLAAEGVECGSLLLVDLVCGGVPSLEPRDVYRRLRRDVVSVVSYRDKSGGWKSRRFKYRLRVREASGRETDEGPYNALTLGFTSEIFRRESCGDCQFAGQGRVSDLTLGDFWGIEDFPEEHFGGISCIVANSAKGAQALRDAAGRLCLHPADYADLEKGNPRVECGNSPVFARRLKKFLYLVFFRVQRFLPLPGILLHIAFMVMDRASKVLRGRKA